MTLATALQPLAQYRQFITYKTEPTATPGKLNKIPTDWRTGQPANAHDPAIWTDYDTAYACSAGYVGFVFTDADPFFFLDIDNCLVDGAWSPLALELCELLRGAAVEVSISGKGMHVFGVGKVPKHSTRSNLGLELYHTARFVALGSGAMGNALTDCTAGLAEVVARYFTPRSDVLPTDWTDGPVSPDAGVPDNDELIRRACDSKSAAGVFGSKATFAHLWDADVTVLSKCYPDEARGYDASTADAALAQHLAFWTGKDCARIERLMRKSKLARAKWDDHNSYMQRTILQAVAQQKDVFKVKPVEAPAPALGVRDVEGETWLQPEDMKIMFAGCAYIIESHTILMTDGSNLNEGRFNVMLGGFNYTIDRNNGKLAKSPWDAFNNSKDVRFPKVHHAEFAPHKAAGEIWTKNGKNYVNSYRPVPTDSKKGNPKPFIDHLARVLPVQSDRDIVLAYMAAVVQYPGVKFQWCPLIQGAEGNGKSLFSRCVAEAVGDPHSHWPVAGEIGEKFNSWIEGKIFIGVEDIYIPDERKELIEVLKPMITGSKLEIRGMGREKVTRSICANFILNSNHKDAVRKTKNDRRFAVFYTAQQSYEDILTSGMGGDYFVNLYNWLRRDGYAIVTDYLKNYAIPDALNPATDCHRAPLTSSTSEAVTASAGMLEQEIIEAIEQERVGFRNGWISSHYLDILIRDMKLERRYPRNKRTDLMLEMGYFLHAGLPGGQTHNRVSPDDAKPRLYIMANHHAERFLGADVARQYTADQLPPSGHLRAVA